MTISVYSPHEGSKAASPMWPKTEPAGCQTLGTHLPLRAPGPSTALLTSATAGAFPPAHVVGSVS